jgi:thioredoxin reductase (NADPH)
MEHAPGTAFQRQKGFDLLVLGGGIAGLTAAWQAARQGVSVALLEAGPLFGGQVATLGAVDDYPGAAPPGADLAAELIEAARRAGAAIEEEAATAIAVGDGGLLHVQTARWLLKAHAVALATGARLRKLEVPGAAEFDGRGLSHCATCDGPILKGRDAVVAGGGDAALQAAIQLAQGCRGVTVVVRGRLRAQQAYIDAAARCANLRFVWDAEVVAVLGGDAGLEAVRVRNAKTGETRDIACYGFFPLIGVAPAGELAANLARFTRNGHVRVDKDLQAATPGLYAIGAVREGFGGSLVSAAGDGAAVARQVAGPRRR